MKKVQFFVGLPVMGIDKGEQLGVVAGFIVNPDTGRVDYLLLERDVWYGEMKAMNYDAVLGVGEFAVMTANGNEICYISERPEIVSLLEKGVRLINAGVVIRSGEYVGVVSEYIVDEKTGDIAGCEISSEGRDKIIGIVPGNKIITYGVKYIVIEDGLEEFIVSEICDTVANVVQRPVNTKPLPQSAAVKENPALEPPPLAAIPEEREKKVTDDPLELFEARRREYLLGKKASKKITGADGKVIVGEGEAITDEIIERAVSGDKYIELTMNVK